MALSHSVITPIALRIHINIFLGTDHHLITSSKEQLEGTSIRRANEPMVIKAVSKI